ncbi:metal-dependent hydrolase [Taibaiella sp. KBW10]|uniref:metal-dependent hydrolase n=1 Tax=Taibaiella sp. KBW10 TaxID=2153357 RepID=UPI000F597CEE|nr:metal-dependent hydrolase [Taibaiella sp. KBW10]RQO31999.1 metal-dependent hydrolase [Taibaiella sp. KBW10]
MTLTFFGHACFTVAFGDTTILFDPFITPNALAKDVDIEAIKADYIFVSHGHGDHVADLIALAKQTQATVVSNFEIIDWVTKQGYEKVHPMNFGRKQFAFGKVHFVPAAHSSGLPDGSYGGNPGGFVIKTDEGNFYYTGDTSLTAEFNMIPYYGPLDVAIMPIGGNFTMDTDDALIASDMIQCNKIVGVHYDTFGYIVIDKEKALRDFEQAGKQLLLPKIGETIEL